MENIEDLFYDEHEDYDPKGGLSFVGFFDILGFKELVSNNSHNYLIWLYKKVLYEQLDERMPMQRFIYSLIPPIGSTSFDSIRIQVISDSIIVVQNDTTQKGLLCLIAFCKVLMQSCMEDGMPLRGGISAGLLSQLENKYGRTVLGDPLVNAYSLESKQNWSGAILDPICFDLLSDGGGDGLRSRLLGATSNILIHQYKVPFKDGTYKMSLCIDWTDYEPLKDAAVVERSFERHKKTTVEETVKVKIRNTVDYFIQRRAYARKPPMGLMG